MATLTDGDGKFLRYTARQRSFESKLTRYRIVLKKEKDASGVSALETELSQHSCRTNEEHAFFEYLLAKKKHDKATEEFYRKDTWRNWRFRICSSRNSSEACFLNRVKATYGPDCAIYYGNWSRKDQMNGCEPSPTVGLKKALRKRFLSLGPLGPATRAWESWRATERKTERDPTRGSVARTADVQTTDQSTSWIEISMQHPTSCWRASLPADPRHYGERGRDPERRKMKTDPPSMRWEYQVTRPFPLHTTRRLVTLTQLSVNST